MAGSSNAAVASDDESVEKDAMTRARVADALPCEIFKETNRVFAPDGDRRGG